MAVELAHQASAFVSAVESLDEAIHQKARLGIISTLATVGEAEFKLLKESLALSDGNLSTHLTYLESRGYVELTKSFKGKRPLTTVSLTEQGQTAFTEYLAALERIIKAAQPH